MMGTRKHAGRAAFTMLELLIVVGIIALLVALLLGGVNRIMMVQGRTETLHEIAKMQQALQVAMQKYKVEYLPSRLVLHNDVSRYTNASATADEKQTANVLRTMFGRHFLSKGTPNWGALNGKTLSGSECLVFYLGGVIDTTGGTPGAVGFSTDPRNPATPGGERIGPFFDFRSPATRLQVSSNGYFQYLDPYGMPYAYFAPTSKNNYNDADCLALGVIPYFEAGTSNPKRYFNPNLFQIISAGRNKTFGPGGALNPKIGLSDDVSADNLTNFSQTELGNPVE